jgi:hypothetical protein
VSEYSGPLSIRAARASERWPQLAGVTVRHHGEVAYVTGQLPDRTALPLMRLRCTGSAAHWGLAIFRASRGDYDKARPVHRPPVRHPGGGPRPRLRPLLGRRYSLAQPVIPGELTGATIS